MKKLVKTGLVLTVMALVAALALNPVAIAAGSEERSDLNQDLNRDLNKNREDAIQGEQADATQLNDLNDQVVNDGRTAVRSGDRRGRLDLNRQTAASSDRRDATGPRARGSR